MYRAIQNDWRDFKMQYLHNETWWRNRDLNIVPRTIKFYFSIIEVRKWPRCEWTWIGDWVSERLSMCWQITSQGFLTAADRKDTGSPTIGMWSFRMKWHADGWSELRPCFLWLACQIPNLCIQICSLGDCVFVLPKQNKTKLKSSMHNLGANKKHCYKIQCTSNLIFFVFQLLFEFKIIVKEYLN